MSAAVIRYCLCGAALRARSVPPEGALAIEAMFYQVHTGSGHGEATAAHAARARRREEQAAIEEPP